MALYVLKDCKLYVAGFDISGDTNTVTIDHGAPELDVTTFGNDSVKRIAGLETVSLSH